jgi:phosphate transport system substrate-binding protein
MAGMFAADNELLGAGATFPQPLYSKMFDIYSKTKGVQVNYQGIGSGGGIKQITSRIIDLGGTDAFMTDKELKDAPGKIVHIPTCLGAVVLSYNLPGDPQLKFTPQLITQIFSGAITKWNDPKIKEVNPGVELPAQDIFIAHRSDSSGTTAIFTDYLSKIDPANWTMDKNFKTKAKLAIGGKGNSGVAGLIKQLPGTIGYIELAYARQNKMAIGIVQNSSRKFIVPSLEATSAAAGVAIPDDTRCSITNTSIPAGYPIAGFTWLVVYQDQNYNGRTAERANNLKDLLTWMVTDGQKLTMELDYAPLPKNAVTKALNNINSIKY